MGKTMTEIADKKMDKINSKYYNLDCYYDDGVPPHIREMTVDELNHAIAEEEARLRVESAKNDAA
jgi:hypothetical protein